MSATALARSVLTALVEAGVTEVVVCPGSRNAPLSFAAYDAAAAGLVRLHTRIDERTAGFLALGLSRNHRRAAVVHVRHRGRQPAPAVLRGRPRRRRPRGGHRGDRPARLRGTGANQTTDQVGVFGPLVATRDASAEVDLLVAGRCTSTSRSTSRWCRRTGGRPTSVPAPAAAGPAGQCT